MSGKIEPRHTEDAWGTSEGFSIETANGSKAAVIAEENGKEIAPRLFMEELGGPSGEAKVFFQKYGHHEGLSKQIELEYKEALQMLAESSEIPQNLKDWATDALSMANQLIDGLKENNFKFVEVESAIGTIELEAFPMQGLGRAPESIADIDGYLTNGDASDVIFGGGTNIYQYAAEIVNAEYLQYQNELGKIHLQQFYDEDIFPLRDIPSSELTKEQKYNLNIFSDMHQDYYFHRPHSDEENVCYQHHMEVQARKDAAMNIDLTSMIIDTIEDPMLNKPDSFDELYTVNFSVPMYDEGLQNLADRTGLLENVVGLNTVRDVIEDDNSVMNVYLDVNEDGVAKLSVSLNFDEAVEVPLTNKENDAFVRMADTILEKEGGVAEFINAAKAEKGQEKPDTVKPKPAEMEKD